MEGVLHVTIFSLFFIVVFVSNEKELVFTELCVSLYLIADGAFEKTAFIKMKQ